MSCQYKDECPSYSGWCEGPKQDFSRCIPFLVFAVQTRDQRIRELEGGVSAGYRQIPVYECDRRACNRCNPDCHHTGDIRHAVNFHITFTDKDGNIYFTEGEK